jgi:transposase
MLSLPLPVRIFLCTQPADMRRSFDGLAQMVREFLGSDPLCGHLFVFRSKRGDRLKLLYWDSDGLAIWYKKQVADYTHSLLFTEFDAQPHNRAIRLATIDRMDSIAFRGSRRCPMSRGLNTIAPPRAHSG